MVNFCKCESNTIRNGNVKLNSTDKILNFILICFLKKAEHVILFNFYFSPLGKKNFALPKLGISKN